jgi:hypothetical protein
LKAAIDNTPNFFSYQVLVIFNISYAEWRACSPSHYT